MNNLIAFLGKYNYWFIFIILETVCAVLLFRYNSYQGSVWFSSANVISGKVYEWRSNVETFFLMSKANEQLTARNIELEQELSQMREFLLDVKADTLKLDSTIQKSLSDIKLYAAKVVSNSLEKKDNLITINKGTIDGIRPDMGVICGEGVVGVVCMASAHYATVIPVLSSLSNISCQVEGSEYFGYLHWQGGDTRYAYLDDVPRHARFKKDARIVTSGYSSIFPKGVLVGKMIHVYNSPNGLSYRLKIALSTDFSHLRDVFVVDNQKAKEQIELQRMVKDTLQIK